MKKLIVAGVVILSALALAGCDRVGSFKEAVEARDECIAAGGSFDSWPAGDADNYAWACDLSTGDKK